MAPRVQACEKRTSVVSGTFTSATDIGVIYSTSVTGNVATNNTDDTVTTNDSTQTT